MGQDTRTLGSSRCCHKRTDMKEEGCLVAFDRAVPLRFASSRCTHFTADLHEKSPGGGNPMHLPHCSSLSPVRHGYASGVCSLFWSGGCPGLRSFQGKRLHAWLRYLIQRPDTHSWFHATRLYCTPLIVGCHSPTDKIDLERVISSPGWLSGHPQPANPLLPSTRPVPL